MKEKLGRTTLYALNLIKDEYQFADNDEEAVWSRVASQHRGRPWVVGFSGGKDSTAMLVLVWWAMQELREEGHILRRKVYVTCNDTLVENPVIASYVNGVLRAIAKGAKEQGLPIEVRQTVPEADQTFWVNVIGRGYPLPLQNFRWCTDRLKIRPSAKVVDEVSQEWGSAVLVIGTRDDESASRKRSNQKHTVRGKRLSPHPLNPQVEVFKPIRGLMAGHVWGIINGYPAPWGGSNRALTEIYLDASADDYECPTTPTSDSHKSCGQSRFGCWVCPLVKEDKSMKAQAEEKHPELLPLLEFRNQLVSERDDISRRSPYMGSGRLQPQGKGQYSMDYRAEILTRLLDLEKRTGFSLISGPELCAVDRAWAVNLNPDTFYHIGPDRYPVPGPKKLSRRAYTRKVEERIKDEVFEGKPDERDLVDRLLAIQDGHTKGYLRVRKTSMRIDMEKELEGFFKKKGIV